MLAAGDLHVDVFALDMDQLMTHLTDCSIQSIDYFGSFDRLIDKMNDYVD